MARPTEGRRRLVNNCGLLCRTTSLSNNMFFKNYCDERAETLDELLRAHDYDEENYLSLRSSYIVNMGFKHEVLLVQPFLLQSTETDSSSVDLMKIESEVRVV